MQNSNSNSSEYKFQQYINVFIELVLIKSELTLKFRAMNMWS